MTCRFFSIKIAFYFFTLSFFESFSSAKQSNIVTTIPYLQDLVQNVTCNNKSISIESIVPTGTDPHTFSIKPSQRLTIQNAAMVIEIGGEFEHWLDKIPKNKNQIRLALIQNTTTDPHIWQSPELTKMAVQKISQSIVEAHFLPKEEVQRCSQNYLKEIDATVKTLKKEIETIPSHKRILATNHDSLSYFAQAFGFQLVSILGASDEAAPTSAQIKNMIQTIRKQHVAALFLESTGDMKGLETVRRETGVKIGGKLYGDSLGSESSGANTTLGMWKTNVTTLVRALK